MKSFIEYTPKTVFEFRKFADRNSDHIANENTPYILWNPRNIGKFLNNRQLLELCIDKYATISYFQETNNTQNFACFHCAYLRTVYFSVLLENKWIAFCAQLFDSRGIVLKRNTEKLEIKNSK